MNTQPLGIVAGGGSLPALLIEECDRQKRPVFIVAFEGQTDSALYHNRPHILSRPDKAGVIIKRLREEGVSDLVLIGSVKRPHLTDLRPDLFTTGFFARMGLRALGDSDLLSAVRHTLEKEGLKIHAVHEFNGDVLMPQGVQGKVRPSSAHEVDIDLGMKTAMALGMLDVGQSVVVRDGMVLGVEGVEGTDELIRRCAGYRTNGKGGVLVKACKPQQDRALDLPTIGLNTVRLCAELKFDGIAISAGEALFADRGQAIPLADASGLFITGVKA
jgi:DUF1009 family protein